MDKDCQNLFFEYWHARRNLFAQIESYHGCSESLATLEALAGEPITPFDEATLRYSQDVPGEIMFPLLLSRMMGMISEETQVATMKAHIDAANFHMKNVIGPRLSECRGALQGFIATHKIKIRKRR